MDPNLLIFNAALVLLPVYLLMLRYAFRARRR